MSTASLKTRLIRLETATPAAAEVSLDELDALVRRLDLANVDLDSPTGSPALVAAKAELKALLARMTEGQPECPTP